MTTMPVGSTVDKIEKWFKTRLNEPQKTGSPKNEAVNAPDLVIISPNASSNGSNASGTAVLVYFKGFFNGAWDSLKKIFATTAHLKEAVDNANNVVANAQSSGKSPEEIAKIKEEQINIVSAHRDRAITKLKEVGSPEAVELAQELAALDPGSADYFDKIGDALDRFEKMDLGSEAQGWVAVIISDQVQLGFMARGEMLDGTLSIDELRQLAQQQLIGQGVLKKVQEFTNKVLQGTAPEAVKNEAKASNQAAEREAASTAVTFISIDQKLSFLATDQRLSLAEMALSAAIAKGGSAAIAGAAEEDGASSGNTISWAGGALETLTLVYDIITKAMENDKAGDVKESSRKESQTEEKRAQEKKDVEKKTLTMNRQKAVSGKKYLKMAELASQLKKLDSITNGLLGSRAYVIYKAGSMKDEINRLTAIEDQLLEEVSKKIQTFSAILP